MHKRYFLSLLITLSIYQIPGMIYNAHGYWAWIDSAFWSCTYIVLTYKYAKTRLMPLVLTAEFIALTSILIAFAEHYIVKKDWFFYQNYETVINACFAAELIIITVGAVNGGVFKRIQRLWNSIDNSNKYHRSLVFRSQEPV